MGLLTGREPTAVDDFRRELYRLKKDDYHFCKAVAQDRVIVVMYPRQFDELMADSKMYELLPRGRATPPISTVMGIRIFLDVEIGQGYAFYVQASAT